MEFKSVSGKEDVFGKNLIVPDNFENIAKAVKNLSNYKGPRKITKLHRILMLGFSLKAFAEIATLKYIKENADTKVTECQKFMYLSVRENILSMPIMLALFTEKGKLMYQRNCRKKKRFVKAVRSYCINESLRICR